MVERSVAEHHWQLSRRTCAWVRGQSNEQLQLKSLLEIRVCAERWLLLSQAPVMLQIAACNRYAMKGPERQDMPVHAQASLNKCIHWIA